MSGSFGQFVGPVVQLLGIIEGSAGGALPALLAQLENAGLSGQVRTWIGHGENSPVTPEELSRAFTAEQVEGWAAQSGMRPEALLHHLSTELPQAVHALSQEEAGGAGPRA